MQNLHSLQLRQQTCQVGPATFLLMRNSLGQLCGDCGSLEVSSTLKPLMTFKRG